MNLMNLIGNAVVIFGFKMGVAGAAISTTLSRTVAAGFIFYLLFQKDRVICFKKRVTARLNMEQIKRILYIGIPNGLENSLYHLTPETENLAVQVIRYHAFMCMFA